MGRRAKAKAVGCGCVAVIVTLLDLQVWGSNACAMQTGQCKGETTCKLGVRHDDRTEGVDRGVRGFVELCELCG